MGQTRRIACITLAILALVVGGCASHPAARTLAQIHRDEVTPHQDVFDEAGMVVLLRLYRQQFHAHLASLDALSDEDVEAGWLTAHNAAFYAHYYDPMAQPALLDASWRWLDELHRRDGVSDRQALFAHHLFMTARQFDRADVLRKRHPQARLPHLPPIRSDASFDPSAPAVYSLEGNGEGFRLHNLHLDRQRSIIVVAGCPISRNAARDIQADPALRKAFADGNVTWLGSADALHLDEVRQWNEALPHAPLLVVHGQQQWPGLDFTAHPTFHFFVDGELVASHSGWSPEGAPEPVIDGLKAMGLLPEAR